MSALALFLIMAVIGAILLIAGVIPSVGWLLVVVGVVGAAAVLIASSFSGRRR